MDKIQFVGIEAIIYRKNEKNISGDMHLSNTWKNHKAKLSRKKNNSAAIWRKCNTSCGEYKNKLVKKKTGKDF